MFVHIIPDSTVKNKPVSSAHRLYYTPVSDLINDNNIYLYPPVGDTHDVRDLVGLTDVSDGEGNDDESCITHLPAYYIHCTSALRGSTLLRKFLHSSNNNIMTRPGPSERNLHNFVRYRYRALTWVG